MAAVAATTAAWDTERKNRCFQQFIDSKCMKSGFKYYKYFGANASADINITQLDERKMKAHILDCAAALGFVQQERVRQGKPLIFSEGEQPLSAATQASCNRIFATVVKSVLDQELTYEDAVVTSGNKGLKCLLRAFPDNSKLTDGRGWLPLHWALITDGVTEADTKLVYSSDHMAIQKCHLQGTGMDNLGFTPVHLLCMQGVTNRSMSLVQHFSMICQQAFTTSASYSDSGDPLLYGYTALHAACAHGQPTEELLQYVLQLDRSQMKKMTNLNGGLTPLGYLCKNSRGSDRLIQCLLEVDSSAEVVWSGILGCTKSTDCSHVLERIELLLKANPEAAKYRIVNYSKHLLHSAIRFDVPFHECIDIMQWILAIHNDAVREVDENGLLPVHYAARHSTVEVMEFLLGLYPESASAISGSSENLLHMVAYDKQNTDTVVEAKVKFLCSRYPAMILQRQHHGNTPLHRAIHARNRRTVQILCEVGGQEQVKAPVAHPTDANFNFNGQLPLHDLITYIGMSPLDLKAADCFRIFLGWYPEAAGIEGVYIKKTPYDMAVNRDLLPYYLRMLLRAAPNQNPAELHRLNYEERRMAMFLAFKAQTSQPEPVILARFRFAKKDLLKHVISFL